MDMAVPILQPFDDKISGRKRYEDTRTHTHKTKPHNTQKNMAQSILIVAGSRLFVLSIKSTGNLFKVCALIGLPFAMNTCSSMYRKRARTKKTHTHTITSTRIPFCFRNNRIEKVHKPILRSCNRTATINQT